ncbi:MAG: L-serine ammonia-lyase [Cyanobacteria bacterium SZAS TMP-1]|nr:L-serine ammonia-lyase [Cyanobacteria bacterium SZAS TMP-1]
MNPLRADLISPLDMFKIGVGPSSSHTVGPMIAALEFRRLASEKLAALAKDKSGSKEEPYKLVVELFGSLSLTGRGHQTDGAICGGLAGLNPQSSPIDQIWSMQEKLNAAPTLDFAGVPVHFRPQDDIVWHEWLMDEKPLPHPNTLRFRLKQGAQIIYEEIILSVGGGFIEPIDRITGERRPAGSQTVGDDTVKVPYPYNSAQEYVEQCKKSGLPPWQIVIANQEARGLDEKTLRQKLAAILEVFDQCIERGLNTDGILPGGLNVRRRAKGLNEKMLSGKQSTWASPFGLKPSVYAIAVNEENAAGGRVVTAPTNGSSGLIPAVWRTLKESHDLDLTTLQNGLIVASVIGALVKVHASISGAEVGCQGEVGTSCAMAAGGAAAMLGGSPEQIEQAAEIGIEHHLGMTCDPIKGLVQVPCIERNAMGAVKALNAVELSLACDGSHLISLDRALIVMKATGMDMHQKYKETATGGLALG